MVYEYDGSYNGFLCCIFESYINREFPIAFVSNEEFPALSLYSVRNVETVLAHSNRVLRSITDRSPRAARLLYRAFHTCMDNREICLYRFVQKLYADGPQFLRRPSDEACFPLYKAVRHLSGELENSVASCDSPTTAAFWAQKSSQKTACCLFCGATSAVAMQTSPFSCMTEPTANYFCIAAAVPASCRRIP